MRSKYILIAGVLLALGFGAGRLSAASGSLDSPAPPGSTYSYSLDDIYNRLDTGAAGTQSTFAEPASGPEAWIDHTLNEIMAKAPATDDANGAIQADVLAGKALWGLTSGQWGPITGTMPNNGAVTIVPTTTAQTIAAGYHNGSGYVEGDADLVADNIKGGVSVFGVDGTLYAPVPKTGQTQCYTTAVGSETPCPVVGYPGQDGDYQTGVAWPTPRFVTSTAGIVTDTLTGLIWLQDANCISTTYKSFDNDGTSGDGRVTWQHALDFVVGLTVTGPYSGCAAGFNDWRLPNVRELESLLHFGVYDPPVPNTVGTGKWAPGDPFINIEPYYYWSSTTVTTAASHAWRVALYSGSVSLEAKTVMDYVWPVRGGQ